MSTRRIVHFGRAEPHDLVYRSQQQQDYERERPAHQAALLPTGVVCGLAGSTSLSALTFANKQATFARDVNGS